uniref:PRANC domain-containing protein n=2 Tax=Trichogramma kaykai TaxID=54128 RepID=A0ABD2WJG0_9HYME
MDLFNCVFQGLMEDGRLMEDGGPTRIHHAARTCGSTDFPDYLFDDVCDENHGDEKGVTYFHIACYTGNAKVVRKFIDLGVDVNLRCDKYYHDSAARTPLLLALEGRHAPLVKFLLKRGADVDITTEDGYFPLNVACRNIANPILDDSDEFSFSSDHPIRIDLKILRLLMKNNCDVNKKSRDGESPMFSLFHNATSLQSRQCLHTLTNKEAAYDKMIAKSLDMLLKHGADVNEKNSQGVTLLQKAVNLLNYEAVKLLVENGANIHNIQFNEGYLNPDSRALRNRYKTQSILAIIELLKSKGYKITKDHYASIFNFLIGFECVNNLNLFDIVTSGSLQTIHHTIGLMNIKLGTGTHNLEHYREKHEELFHTDYCVPLYYHFIRGYLEFIEAGQMYIDRDIKNFLLESLRRLNYFILDNHSVNHYKTYVVPLIKKSSKTMISDGVSLLDLCTSRPEKVFKLLNESNYKSVMNAELYKSNFKFMADIIDGHVTKGLIRGFFLTMSPEFLHRLTNLPDLCCINIVKYLKNEDLLSMCKSVICKA